MVACNMYPDNMNLPLKQSTIFHQKKQNILFYQKNQSTVFCPKNRAYCSVTWFYQSKWTSQKPNVNKEIGNYLLRNYRRLCWLSCNIFFSHCLLFFPRPSSRFLSWFRHGFTLTWPYIVPNLLTVAAGL